MTCEEACCNCGNDIGPHHLCTDCLEELSGGVDKRQASHERGRLRDLEQGGVSPTLNAFDNATETRATVIVTAPTLTAANDPSRSPQSSEVTAQVEAVVSATNATCVRRLTPIECERLQGFPDNWTEGLADTHRYKQMGNAVTVNVAHYLGWLLADA